MKGLLARGAALTVALLAAVATPSAGAKESADAWSTNVAFTNVVATSPTSGGGYPVPPGSRVPLAGTCRAGPFDANHSESWLAVKP